MGIRRPSTTSRRIAQRVNAEIVATRWRIDPERCFIRRTHVGRHLRAAGAWTWELAGLDGRPAPPLHVYVGSVFPAREIAAAPAIAWNDNCGHIELSPDRTPTPAARSGPRAPRPRWDRPGP